MSTQTRTQNGAKNSTSAATNKVSISNLYPEVGDMPAGIYLAINGVDQLPTELDELQIFCNHLSQQLPSLMAKKVQLYREYKKSEVSVSSKDGQKFFDINIGFDIF